MADSGPFPPGTKPAIRWGNGTIEVYDEIEDAPLVTITGHNGVDPWVWLNWYIKLAAKSDSEER